jgi:hypothetical protein
MVRKPFFKLKEMREAYEADHKKYGVDSNFAIHFRFSTHGKKDETCTHPHLICNGQVGLMHNGILDMLDVPRHDISDTVFFCRTVLAQRDAKQVMSKEFSALLAEMIGSFNKFILMNRDGNVMIVNDTSGYWKDSQSLVKDHKRWFSNSNYENACYSRSTEQSKRAANWLMEYEKKSGYSGYGDSDSYGGHGRSNGYSGYRNHNDNHGCGYPPYVDPNKPTGAIEIAKDMVQGELTEIVTEGQLVPTTDLTVSTPAQADLSKLPATYMKISDKAKAESDAHTEEQKEIENLFIEANERDEWDRLTEGEWRLRQEIGFLEQAHDDALAEGDIAKATDLAVRLMALDGLEPGDIEVISD